MMDDDGIWRSTYFELEKSRRQYFNNRNTIISGDSAEVFGG